jgi:hypothetical protein
MRILHIHSDCLMCSGAGIPQAEVYVSNMISIDYAHLLRGRGRHATDTRGRLSGGTWALAGIRGRAGLGLCLAAERPSPTRHDQSVAESRRATQAAWSESNRAHGPPATGSRSDRELPSRALKSRPRKFASGLHRPQRRFLRVPRETSAGLSLMDGLLTDI